MATGSASELFKQDGHYEHGQASRCLLRYWSEAERRLLNRGRKCEFECRPRLLSQKMHKKRSRRPRPSVQGRMRLVLFSRRFVQPVL